MRDERYTFNRRFKFQKGISMTRIKFVFGALAVAAMVSLMPQANAQTLKVVLAGSSAQWQTLALGAYNAGKCVSGGTAPCSHYTNSSFNLNDTRPSTKTGGVTAVDSGAVWIIWDSAATPNVWAFIKVDSGVGDRCYFAQPHCNISVTTFPTPGNLISSALWGDDSVDSTPSTAIQNIFTSGTALVNAAASDIRPEDALFATCRANSALGNSTSSTDGLGGLGYGVNASGVCPTYSKTEPLANLEGSDILSGYPGSTGTAHLLAFAISGKDPFTGTPVPAATTVSVGATPVVFIISRSGALSGAENATDSQLQTLFSGADCDGGVVGGSGGAISVYLREPTSGTMNTAEYTVFRYWNESGASQETGVNSVNPLETPCTAGGTRYRAIGTSEEVKSVLNSNSNHGNDGIGYTFFSYGNVSSIASSSSYGYLTLDGIDGIFHKYGTTIDPGQPSTAGELPGTANLPTACGGAFPCKEGQIWSGNLSFPNLRNGSYRAWSNLRTISNGTALTALETLVTGSQTYVVNTTPDFVPAVKVGSTDPGLPLLRSHYLQEGVAPVNISTAGDKGGDVGGCILTNTGTVSTSDTTTTLVQVAPLNACVVFN
jgi:hypothetical protein